MGLLEWSGMQEFVQCTLYTPEAKFLVILCKCIKSEVLSPEVLSPEALSPEANLTQKARVLT